MIFAYVVCGLVCLGFEERDLKSENRNLLTILFLALVCIASWPFGLGHHLHKGGAHAFGLLLQP